MKRNPQARLADDIRQCLIVHRHWNDFLHHRHRKPWMWAQPILAPKPKPGRYRPGPLWVHPYQTKKKCQPGTNIRMIR